MAKPIKKVTPLTVSEEEQRQKDLFEVEEALLANKEAILETLKVLGYMHNRGLLPMLAGLLGQGDKVLNIAVKAMDKPENTNALKNLLLMAGTLGMINVSQLEPILLKVNAGIANASKNLDSDEKTGFFDMIRALRDPEVNQSITLMLNFLKGMGQDIERFEKNQDNPDPAQQQNRGQTFE